MDDQRVKVASAAPAVRRWRNCAFDRAVELRVEDGAKIGQVIGVRSRAV